MKRVPEPTVSSWKELRDVLEDLASAGWAFRGHADARWPLESSLTRYLTTFGGTPDKWLARETKILKTFKRKAHLLLSGTPESDETLEWLAIDAASRRADTPSRLHLVALRSCVFRARTGHQRCRNLGYIVRTERSELSWLSHLEVVESDTGIGSPGDGRNQVALYLFSDVVQHRPD